MSQSYSLETPVLRLRCLQQGDSITGFTLETRVHDGWKLMAQTQPLSHVIYLDSAGQRQEFALNASGCTASADSLKLTGSHTDADGITWNLEVKIAKTDNPHQLTTDYRLQVSGGRKLLRWLGPSLHVGEGSFGTAKSEALLPGLEYLLDDEPSSDTRFAAPKYANRATPHPYKVTVPLMAVSHDDTAVGLLWDYNQSWGSAWRHPTALFASPNHLQEGAANHWLGLFTPGNNHRNMREGDTEAYEASGIGENNPHTLSARLTVVPDSGVMGIMRQWVTTYGLPSLPDPGHNYRENVDLCIESYLDVAWDAAAQGWHHTLADPWGPRFEPILANQLWRYSRWSDGDPVLRARARDQVHRAIPQAFEKQPPPHNVPRLELALTYGNVAASLAAAEQAARELMTEQQADGSWGWTPAAIADVADFKTEERMAVMGKEQDSATGFTSSKVIPVLKYALTTGDAAAVDSIKRAADWCNNQRRPEGAQTWELHLHVPDVLAVPYLINLNLGVYQLTGDASYLKAAHRWAWTGLAFTFLWNPYYRPVMRFGTIPVFGVTFHDVQSWFGVIVHWNGLWYSDALYRLAAYERTDGPIDWYDLAEGITRHGMQEQALSGPYKGMYPDAFSTVHGDEEYTWWLNPQLIGMNTLPLAGLAVNSDPLIVRPDEGETVHITSGATIAYSQLDKDALTLILTDQPNQTSYTLIAGRKPTSILCEGAEIPAAADVETVAQGWQWLDDQHIALIKIQHDTSAVTVRCHF